MIRLAVALAAGALAIPAAAAPPEITSVRAASEKVGRYEKFELRVGLRATFTNPYDPDEVGVWAEFTAPSGKQWQIHGFYNPADYIHEWMVRFAPNETGTWRYAVKARDAEGFAEAVEGEFTAVESGHHGFLEIAPNRRYLRYSDGTSWYGVGLWYNDASATANLGAITEAGLDELKSLGVNFISLFLVPLETMGTGLGRYDQRLAARLDEIFEWCEARDIHISLNVWFHSFLSETVWGGPNTRYQHNPYRLVAAAPEFFASEEAWKYQEKLYRYIIARWGYSRALFLWFLVDEINGTDGWVHGGPETAEAWSLKVHEYFRRHDPYRRPTTGSQSGGIERWWPEGYQIFDIANREIYEAQGHPMPPGGKPNLVSENPLKFSYLNYATQVRNLWEGFRKPAMVGETGWDHTYYEPGMPGYLALYHNALWVSLANGLSMTPLWWAYQHPSAHRDPAPGPLPANARRRRQILTGIHDGVVAGHLRYFAKFVEDIDFANLEWAPAEIDAGAGDAWAMGSPEMVFGWMVNPASGVAGESFTVTGLAGGEYEVRLYRTWRGEYLEPQRLQAAGGKLTVSIPERKTTRGHADHIGADVAFKIVPARAAGSP